MKPAGGGCRREATRRGALTLLLAASVATAAGPAAGGGREPGSSGTAPGGPAGRDSAEVREVLDRHSTRMDSLLLPESTRFDSTGIDSLVRRFDTGGAPAIQAFRPGWNRRPGLAVSFQPLALTTYNRVEGLRPGVGLALQAGGLLRAEGAGAYGFSNHRWGGRGGVTVGPPRNTRLQVQGMNLVQPFGPGSVEYSYGLQALVAGQDRRDYLRRREVRAIAWPVRFRGGSVNVALFHREDSPVEAATGYSLFGGNTPMDSPNPAVSAGRARGVSLGANAAIGEDLLSVAGEAGVAGGSLGGDFDYSWQAARATLRPVLPDGGIFSVAIEGARVAGEAPFQARPFLGGDGNLRGYNRLQYVGDRRLSARIEYEIGLDLLGRTGIPFLKPFRIQFIPFADLGTTWDETRLLPGVPIDGDSGGAPARPRGENLDGALRSTVGLGLQRELWLPGVRAIRLDVIRRTDGSDRPWSLWFRILPFAG